MRHDFVKQDNRRNSRHRRDEISMRQHESDQQRFLFSSRGVPRDDAFGRVNDMQVRDVRSFERAACGGIARSVAAQQRPVAVLDFDCRKVRHHAFQHALDGNPRRGKRAARIVAGGERRCEAIDCVGTCRRNCDRKLGGFVFDGVEPVLIRLRIFKQPVA